MQKWLYKIELLANFEKHHGNNSYRVVVEKQFLAVNPNTLNDEENEYRYVPGGKDEDV